MSELIIALDDRIRQLQEWIEEDDFHLLDPEFREWLEKKRIPKLMLEYMGRGNIIQKEKEKMSLQQLKDSPDGTKMPVQAQVVDAGTMGPGKFGPWGKIQVEDTSGRHEMTYSCGDKNPVHVQLNQVYEFQMKCTYNGQYRNLSGYVKAAGSPQAAAPPPAQTLADTNQYTPPPANTSPAATSAAPPVAQAPVASAQQSLKPELTVKDKSIMVQVAAQITRDLIVAGKGPDRPGECVHSWTHYMIDAYNSIGIAGQGFPATGPANISAGVAASPDKAAESLQQDKIPF